MPTTPPDRDDLPDAPASATPSSSEGDEAKNAFRTTLTGAAATVSPYLEVGNAEVAPVDMLEQEDATVAFTLTPEMMAMMAEDPGAIGNEERDEEQTSSIADSPSQVEEAAAITPADLPEELAEEDRTVAFVPPPELFEDGPDLTPRHEATTAYSLQDFAAHEGAAIDGGNASAEGGEAQQPATASAGASVEVPQPTPSEAADSAPGGASESSETGAATPTSDGHAAQQQPSSSKEKQTKEPASRGKSVLELLREGGAMGYDDAVTAMCKIAAEVQKLHADSQAHGGLTPAHILVGPDNGITLVAADRVKVKERFSVQYEAPELHGGVMTERTTPIRSDVYALGCILFQMLTGKAPFRAKTAEEIRKRHAKFAVPAARQIRADLEMPPALEVQLQRAMKKRPADRPASAGDFAQAIAYATSDDDRGTVHLAGDQAKLLQELIAQKTESHVAKQRLEEQRRKAVAEKEAAEAEKRRAGKEAARAAEEARRAEQEAARAADEARRAEQEQADAQRTKKRWIAIAVAGLIVSIGAAGAFYALYEAEEIIVEKEVEKIVTQEKVVEVEVEKVVEKKIFVDGGTRVIYVEKDAGSTEKKRRKPRRRPKPKATERPPPSPPKAPDGPAVF